jgi:hypothetical protein
VHNIQPPPISRNDLIEIFNAKIASIYSINIVFDESTETYNTNGKVEYKESFSTRFVISKGAFFVDHTILAPASSKDKKICRMSYAYNGEQQVSVRYYNNNDIPNAYITNSVAFSNMFPSLNPLSFSGILNRDVAKKAELPLDDIPSALADFAIICPETLPGDDKEYLLASNFSRRFYFDPEKDYSVVRIENIVFESSRVGLQPALIKNCEIKNSEFVNCGNGIWFPQKIEIINFENKRVIGKCLILISSIEINKPIDSNLFEGFIPNDAFVVDSTRDICYMQSDHPSIDNLLKETVKSKRILMFRYISIISGFALIFIALGLKYLAYLKAKRERKNKTVAEEETK